MTPEEKERVVEILELAHDHALAGQLVAFRLACIDLGAQKTKEAMIAGLAIEKAIRARGITGKPSREDYPAIICDAITLALTDAAPTAGNG